MADGAVNQAVECLSRCLLAPLLAAQEAMGQQDQREVVLLGAEASGLAVFEPGELVFRPEPGLNAPAVLVQPLDRASSPVRVRADQVAELLRPLGRLDTDQAHLAPALQDGGYALVGRRRLLGLGLGRPVPWLEALAVDLQDAVGLDAADPVPAHGLQVVQEPSLEMTTRD